MHCSVDMRSFGVQVRSAILAELVLLTGLRKHPNADSPGKIHRDGLNHQHGVLLDHSLWAHWRGSQVGKFVDVDMGHVS